MESYQDKARRLALMALSHGHLAWACALWEIAGRSTLQGGLTPLDLS